MTDRAYIISRTLEDKIAIAENIDQSTLIVTLGVLKEILALLKEQEAVKPVKQIEENEWTVCGHCREHLISKWMFCPYCGKPVLWEAVGRTVK